MVNVLLFLSTEKGTKKLNMLVKTLLLRRTKDQKSKTTEKPLVCIVLFFILKKKMLRSKF